MASVTPETTFSGQQRGDKIFDYTLRICALVAIVLILAIALVYILNSTETLQRFGLNFFTGSLWDINNEILGTASFIYGTVITSLIALLLAVPFAIGSALFVSEYAPRWLGTSVAFVVELLVTI